MCGTTETTIWSMMHGVTDFCQKSPVGRSIGNTTDVLRPVAVDRKDVSGNQRRVACVARSRGVTVVPDALRVGSLGRHRGISRGMALRGRAMSETSRVRPREFAP